MEMSTKRCYNSLILKYIAFWRYYFMNILEEKGALIIREARELLCIEPYGSNALRARITENFSFTGLNQGLLDNPYSDSVIESGDNTARITNGRISAVVTARKDIGFSIAYYKDGQPILEEFRNKYAPAVRTYPREYKQLGGSDYALKVRFKSNEGELIYGMGQYQQDELELKGCVLELAPKNAQVSIPFYLSSLGYGFLWNNPSIGKVSFGNNYTEWESNCSSEIDYWITVGDTPKGILKNYTEVTGRAPEFPDDLLGLWQCKLRYRTQQEVLEVAREYHRRGLPLDLIVIDYYHWEHDGDWRFDPEYWPDPAAMVRELKEMGTRCMVSVWTTVEKSSINYEEMRSKGLLVTTARGEICGIKEKPLYDPTNAEARAFIWKNVSNNYLTHGIDSYWLDNAEPEYIPTGFEHYNYSVGAASKMAGLYPLMHAMGFYENMKSDGIENPLTLIRSAWVGSQRYGAVVWSGDISSTFETLRAQLHAGLNVGLAGIPWWTTDTAGFNGNVEDPSYNELLVRWFQFSTFSPVLRLHGYLAPYRTDKQASEKASTRRFYHCGQPHELWSHGEDVYEILKKYLFIRIELKDYVKKLMAEASENGSPLLRAMFYEFPEDKKCWELDDQYMFGDRYLVAPVLYEGMRQRSVYLPEGEWKNYHTGESIRGGQTVTVDAPLEIIPVFERV